MEQRRLGKTGAMISVLGFGAAPAAYLKADQDRAAGVIEQLLAAGVNLIDTAASYPGSEEFLGKRFAARRAEFFLVSKCGRSIPESSAADWSDALITASVDRSLRLLKTDHLDLMLLHSCDLATLQKGEAIGALIKAREAGKIRHLGYSGDNDAAAYAAALPEVAAIETSINIADQVNIDQVLPIAQKHDVGIIAKRPVANAAWKEMSKQSGIYSNYAKTYHDRLKAMKLAPASVGFKSKTAADDELSWPEMALRFTLAQAGVTTAIIGTTSPDNAARNLQFANAGGLDHHVNLAIRSAFESARADQSWPGQT